MTFSINTNTAALAALQSLRETNADLTSTQNAVSTGKKVASASDDPAVFVIAQKMNTQISGLSAVSNGLSTGAQVVSTASNALLSIGSALSSIKSLVSEGQSSSIDPSTINSQISNLLSNIDTYAKNATFSGVNLISGGVGSGVTNNQLSLITNADATQSITLGGSGVSAAALSATSNGLGLTGLSTTSTGVSITNVGVGTTGTITLENNTYASGSSASPNGVNAGTAASPAQKWSFTITQGTDATTTTTSSVAQTTGAANDAQGNATSLDHTIAITLKSGATTQDMENAVSAAMKTAGFNATFDSSGTMNVAGNNVTTTGATASSFSTAVTSAASTWSGSEAALATVTAAIDKLGTMETSLGATSSQITGLQSYNSTLSDAMTTGVGALTDADLSEESAKLTSLQTKQQLAIQSLSMANSQSSSILSLFR